MTPKSATLFHFTGQVAYLKGILSKGFMPRYCREDVRWLGIARHNYIAYPMVCFCDIPISRIAEHTKFYGSYGVGVTKRWGVRKGLTPVFYASPQSAARRVTDFLFDLPDTGVKGTTGGVSLETERVARLYDLLSLVKPLNGRMVVNNKTKRKDFYQENEWRFVPKEGSLYFEGQFGVERERANKRMEAHALAFRLADVRYVFVKKDSEIPDLIDFVFSMSKHSQSERKILASRITSLETLSRDV